MKEQAAANWTEEKTILALQTPGGGGEGVLGISSDGDDRRVFLGLKVSFPGFFWVRKLGKYFFWVAWFE